MTRLPERFAKEQMTRLDDIQARFPYIDRDDVGWLLDRVTQLETALTKIEKVPFSEKGDNANLVAYMRRTARAALDTEQT